jgi:hypothetical protein
MHVINARRKGGSHGHASAPHDTGDFDIPVFHRPGCYRVQRSPLNQYPHRERVDTAQPLTGIVFRFCASDIVRVATRASRGPAYPFGTRSAGLGWPGGAPDRRVVQGNFNCAISTMKGKAGYDIEEREK